MSDVVMFMRVVMSDVVLFMRVVMSDLVPVYENGYV